MFNAKESDGLDTACGSDSSQAVVHTDFGVALCVASSLVRQPLQSSGGLLSCPSGPPPSRGLPSAASYLKRRPSLTNIGEPGMLQLRPNCECCDKDLFPESADARICSFECTFCASCAEGVLAGKCPNCGGELVARPRRPAAKLAKFPASTERVLKPHGCKEAA